MLDEANRRRSGNRQSADFNDNPEGLELGIVSLGNWIEQLNLARTIRRNSNGAEQDLFVYAMSQLETDGSNQGSNQGGQRDTNPEFNENSFTEARQHSANTGKPILAVFVNSRTQEYQNNVLPKLREQFADRIVLLVVNTETEAGRKVALQTAWRIGETREAYTMLLYPTKAGGIDEVRYSRYRGTSDTIGRHINDLLPSANKAMSENLFSRKPETTHIPQRSGETTPRKTTTQQTKETTRTPEVKPRGDLDARSQGYRLDDGTEVAYEYRAGNTSKDVPSIIYINGTAWVANTEPKQGHYPTLWHKYKQQNGRWVYQADWHGQMWVEGNNELAIKPKGGETTVWTQRAGVKMLNADGSTTETKGKQILQVTRRDGSSVEAKYLADRVVQYTETVKRPDGSFTIPENPFETVVWVRHNDEWRSEQRPGEVRMGLRLNEKGELTFTAKDGRKHLVDRTGTQTVVEEIEFGETANRTKRQFTSKVHPDGREELIALKVTTADKKVYDWKKVGEDSWTCNGQGAQKCRFELKGEGADKKYVVWDFEKNLQKEYNIPGGEQRWVQTIGDPTVGPTQVREYFADANGTVKTIKDGVTGREWILSNGVWQSGSLRRTGELEVQADGFAFVDKKTGNSSVFGNDGIEELRHKGKTVARLETPPDLVMISPQGRSLRLFRTEGGEITEETVIRPNQKIVWTRHKTGGRHTSEDRWTSDNPDQHPDRYGRGELQSNGAYVFRHTDGRTNTVSGSEETLVHPSGNRAVWQEGVLDSFVIDKTVRKPGWKPGAENITLNALTVTRPDGKVFQWQLVKDEPGKPQQWRCNGSEPGPAAFRIMPNLDYVTKTDQTSPEVLRGFDNRMTITTDTNVVVFQTNNRGTVTEILDSSRSGGDFHRWILTDGKYVDQVTGEVREGTVEHPESGQYAFVQTNGVRFIYRPGESEPERRGTAEDFNRLVARRFQGKPEAYVQSCQQWVNDFHQFAISEGVPSRRLGDLYHRLSERLLSANSKEDLDQIWRELTPRPFLFERTASCSDAHAAAVHQSLSRIPLQVRRELMKRGCTVRAGQTVEELWPGSRNIRPRGYPAGYTWAQADGYYSERSGYGEIGMAQYNYDLYGNYRSRSMTGVGPHEVGHAFYYQVLKEDTTFMKLFEEEYKKDIANMSAYLRSRVQYCIQSDGDVNAGSKAGMSECFAEVTALIFSGQPCNAQDTIDMRNAFPLVRALLEKKYKSYTRG